MHLFIVYNSGVFSIVPELCSHHHYLILQHFLSPPKETSYPLAVITYSSHSLAPNNC